MYNVLASIRFIAATLVHNVLDLDCFACFIFLMDVCVEDVKLISTVTCSDLLLQLSNRT